MLVGYTIASSAVGANILNLPAGYRAVRSSKISSLAVRHLNGGAAIPFKPIGAFANDSDAWIRLAFFILTAIRPKFLQFFYFLHS